MNSKFFLVLLFLVIGVAAFGLIAEKSSQSLSAVSANTQFDQPTEIDQTQEKAMGNVTVTISPVTMLAGEAASFDVALDTHSVELSYDFATIASLTDDAGNSYAVSEWTGNSGGHHVSGQLLFPAISSEATELTLMLKEVDTVTEEFVWKL